MLSSDKVFADETTLPVLDPGRGKTKTGQLWCYAVDDRPWAGPTHPAVAYVYCDGRNGEHPIEHLAAFQGILQVDGYAGYGKLVRARTDGSIQLAYCWVHARRLFYEFYTSTQSPLAAEVLAASPNSMRSRPRSVASRQISGKPSVSVEVDRWSRTCSVGCRSTCRACLAGRTWQKPCVMPWHIGTG